MDETNIRYFTILKNMEAIHRLIKTEWSKIIRSSHSLKLTKRLKEVFYKNIIVFI